MRILVTGGSGRVGRFVVAELAAAGHQITSLDLARPAKPVDGVPTILGNAASAEDAYGALSFSKAQALVHMAAWSDAGIVADTRTFADNTNAVFNLLNACADLGVSRAICASSAQVYGFADHDPVYAPVDEDHPLRPLNAYAQSKVAGETVCDYFARTRDLTVLSFRIMGARAPEDLRAEIASLAAQPEAGRFLLWTRTDARDVARACRQALEAKQVSSGVYNITGASNVLDRDSADLLTRYCPQTERRAGLAGTGSPMSCGKAAAAFGYAPIYDWSLSRSHG